MAKGRKERQEEKKQKEGGAEPQTGRDFWAELKKYFGLKKKTFWAKVKKGNTSRRREKRGAKEKGKKEKNKKKTRGALGEENKRRKRR